jgi:hypothetical protein
VRKRYCTLECREKAHTRNKQDKRDASYTHKKPNGKRGLAPKTIEKLDAVRAILSPDNPIDVRSCCYHLLSLGLLESTAKFGGMNRHITAARIRDEGDNSLPDNCFLDKGRELILPAMYSDIYEYHGYDKYSYRRDWWQNQPVIPLIVCEKAGFGPLIAEVTRELGMRLYLSSGTLGRSFIVKMASDIADLLRNGKRVMIGYFGDWDGAGLMIENGFKFGNEKEGLTSYTEGLRQLLKRKHPAVCDLIDLDKHWIRLGLTWKDFNDLPSKAKVPVKINRTKTIVDAQGYAHEVKVKDDPNAKAYIAKYGKLGAEVNALGREELQRRTREFVEDCILDREAWEAEQLQEKQELKDNEEVTNILQRLHENGCSTEDVLGNLKSLNQEYVAIRNREDSTAAEDEQ